MDVKLIVFDMDGTLLKDRFIQKISQKYGFWEKLQNLIDSTQEEGYKRSQKVATFLKGIPLDSIIEVSRDLEFNPGVIETVELLKLKGINFGIITDSYKCVAEIVAKRIGADFTFANRLKLTKEGIITGELEMPLGWQEIGCYCHNSVCKRYFSQKMATFYGVSESEMVVVGDNISDLCMLEAYPLSFAFQPKKEIVKKKATYVISDMRELLDYL